MNFAYEAARWMALTSLPGLVVMLSVTGMATAQSKQVTKASGRLSRLMREESPDYKLMRTALAVFGLCLLPTAFAAYWLQGRNLVSIGVGVALAVSGLSLALVAAGDWISSRWKLPGPRFHAVSVGVAIAAGGAVVALEALLGWQGHTWGGMFWASISLLGIQLLSAGLMSFTREENVNALGERFMAVPGLAWLVIFVVNLSFLTG